MSGHRVLAVDDDPDVREMLRLMLEAHGFEVLVANGGAEAAAMLVDAAPDVVVADMLMPGGDGLDLCLAVRDLPATASVPIILFTALAEPDHPRLQQALRLPSTHLLGKLRVGQLAALVDELISQSGFTEPAIA